MRILHVIGVGLIVIFTNSLVLGDYEKHDEDPVLSTKEVSSGIAEFTEDRYTVKLSSIATGAEGSWPIIRVRRKREIVAKHVETTKGREENKKNKKEKERERGERERRNRVRKKERKREPLTRHARRRPQRRRTRRPHKEAVANRTRSNRQRNHERRNLEKQYLVRNRTLELLEKKTTDDAGGNRSSFIYPVNNVREVIFERRITPEKIGQILGDGRRAAPSVRIADLLIPKTFREAAKSTKNEAVIKTNRSDTLNENFNEPPLFLGKFKSIAVNVSRMNNTVENFKESESQSVESLRGIKDFHESGYRYDYEDVFEDPSVSPWVNPPRGKEAVAGNDEQEYLLETTLLSSVYMPMDDRRDLYQGLAILLSRLFQTLRNTTDDENKELLEDLDFDNSVQQQSDLCQKWLDCKEKLEEAFLGPLLLPACPCHYPSSIFYDDKIWDEEQQRHFRWRDVSGEAERLDVYKPGATYCVRSLLTQGGGSAAAQHCCYDGRRRLLTRGSGAGTPNFVSPEVSSVLHERIDILPWRLCKGDFSRFNKVRPPNNDNHCKENPDDDEYQRQIDATKHY